MWVYFDDFIVNVCEEILKNPTDYPDIVFRTSGDCAAVYGHDKYGNDLFYEARAEND